MASNNKQIEDNLKTFLDRNATDGLMTLTHAKKSFDQAKLDKYKSILESSAWSVHQNAAKKIAPSKVATAVLEDIAALYVIKKKNLKQKKDEVRENADVKIALEEMRDALSQPSAACTKGAVKVDSTTKRLTDASGYTGSHKERFDADGKGKGIDGRKDIASGDGYVGAYKGKGTYEKK